MKSRSLLFVLISILLQNLYSQTLTPSQAYELSLQNSDKIQSLDYQLKANKESINQAKSRLYPTVMYQTSYQQSNYDINSKVSSVEDERIKQKLKEHSISLNQPIFDVELSSQVDVEESRYKTISAEVELKKQEHARDVLKAYMDLFESINSIHLYESYLEFTNHKMDLISEKYNMNLATKMDLLESKVEYQNALINLDKEKELYEVNKKHLKYYIGDIDVEPVAFKTSNQITLEVEELKKEIDSIDDVNSSLKVQQAQNLLKMYKDEVRNSMSLHLPKINLSAIHTKYDIDNPTADSTYDKKQQFMISLRMPLFQGGYSTSRVAASKLNVKAANKELLDVKKEVAVDYEKLVTVFNTSANSIKLYQEAIKSAKLYATSIEEGFDYGLKSIIDVYEANYKVFELEEKYIKNIYNLMDSYLGLIILTNNFDKLYLVDNILF
ncbi:MAG: TolC family protein [Arcobacter butzleri]|nr:TolC family protein [Aliarcobacter butzleri]